MLLLLLLLLLPEAVSKLLLRLRRRRKCFVEVRGADPTRPEGLARLPCRGVV